MTTQTPPPVGPHTYECSPAHTEFPAGSRSTGWARTTQWAQLVYWSNWPAAATPSTSSSGISSVCALHHRRPPVRANHPSQSGLRTYRTTAAVCISLGAAALWAVIAMSGGL